MEELFTRLFGQFSGAAPHQRGTEQFFGMIEGRPQRLRPARFQAMPRAWPSQKGLRNSVFNTLPTPDSGRLSRNSTLRGHL